MTMMNPLLQVVVGIVSIGLLISIINPITSNGGHGIISSGVLAWIPPPQNVINSEKWENVESMRNRLGISFNYTTHSIHPERCRFLSEKDCQYADEIMYNHTNGFLRRQRESTIIEDSLHNNNNNMASLQDVVQRQLQKKKTTKMNPKKGKIKVLVLLCMFTDHQKRRLVSQAHVQRLFEGKVSEWLEVNSHGLYDIEPVITPWQLSDNTEG